jgi:hypothetical protein
MYEHDFAAFVELLDDAFALNPNWKRPGAKGKALFFRALEPYPLEVISKAMTAHIRDPLRGKFQPAPSDLIAQINGASAIVDGRPGPEEAWAMLPQDERISVIWTTEMQEAWGLALPLLQEGDRVGARMTFKEVYARLVDAAREQGKSPAWQMTLGHDKSGHVPALVEAVRKNRLGLDAAVALLPPYEAPGLLMSLGVQHHPLLAAPSREGQSKVKEILLTLKTRRPK